ncbi:MAG: AAA family ATPase [Oscillatoria sp. SIO1A7]|nr:AAA family ATPase [Oscillatoria sp. SIO1A7]
MIPSDIRLYSWADVEEVLQRIQKQGQWPRCLVAARGYWDQLDIEVLPEREAEAKEWLRSLFESHFRIDPQGQMTDSFIILESASGSDRLLPVFFQESNASAPLPRLKPSLSKPTVLWKPYPDDWVEPIEPLPPDFPPVVALHSFKGGTGRTIHSLALAKAIAKKQQKVLLVDGDLESPGLSWLFPLEGQPISFADFIVLAHGDLSPVSENAIQLTSDRLANTAKDGIYLLPSFRSPGFTSIQIRPEHLIMGSKNTFLLTYILASLGKALNVDAVVVDLRSGLSELATYLILDPRVHRFLVTTLSEQSILGTIRLLEILAERAPAQDSDPRLVSILSQVSDADGDLVAEADRKLQEAARPFIVEDRFMRVVTPKDDRLQVLPASWNEVMTLIERSPLIDAIDPLVESLLARSVAV